MARPRVTFFVRREYAQVAEVRDTASTQTDLFLLSVASPACRTGIPELAEVNPTSAGAPDRLSSLVCPADASLPSREMHSVDVCSATITFPGPGRIIVAVQM